MTESTSKTTQKKKTIQWQLYRKINTKSLSLHDVSAMAGDRSPSPSEREKYRGLKKRYGNQFYSDLLFCLVHQYVSPEMAQTLWSKILRHKKAMNQAVGRNVGVSVAALDYLTNIHGEDTHVPVHTLIPEQKLKTIAEIALKDGLTGLFDVATFYSKLELEMQRYKRYKTEVSILLIDIDDFKRLNDTYGHQTGDGVLVQLSKIIIDKSRELDVSCRYGGEEFGLILPQTAIPDALRIAERIRRSVQRNFAKKLAVTLSIGVANCPSDAKSINALVKKADKALYHSKEHGKNRVTHLHRK